MLDVSGVVLLGTSLQIKALSSRALCPTVATVCDRRLTVTRERRSSVKLLKIHSVKKTTR